MTNSVEVTSPSKWFSVKVAVLEIRLSGKEKIKTPSKWHSVEVTSPSKCTPSKWYTTFLNTKYIPFHWKVLCRPTFIALITQWLFYVQNNGAFLSIKRDHERRIDLPNLINTEKKFPYFVSQRNQGLVSLLTYLPTQRLQPKIEQGAFTDEHLAENSVQSSENRKFPHLTWEKYQSSFSQSNLRFSFIGQ